MSLSTTGQTPMHKEAIMFDHSGLSLAEKTALLMGEILHWREGIEDALQYGEHSHTFDDLVGKVLTGQSHFYN